MGGEIYLKAGVDIAKIYEKENLTEKQIEKIEKASKGGFTEDELKELEEAKIDVSILKKNCQDEEVEDKDNKKEKKTDDDVTKRAEEIADKYCKNLAGNNGDPYSASNPELKALKEAIDAGLIADLGDEGYDKNQIVDIISKAFPSVGIKNVEDGDGSYNCPYGHGEEAQAIYKDFLAELTTATGGGSTKVKEAREKLTQLNTQILDNNYKIMGLESQVDMLSQKVTDKIEDAIDKSKEIAKEQKEDSKQAVNSWMDKYTSSNGEMSYDDFKKGLAGELDGIEGTGEHKLADVILDIIDAERMMSTLRGYVEDIGDLIKDNEGLATELETAKADLDDAIKEESENAREGDEDCKSTDPIGFTSENVRYDFFVDNDDNGDITNETEFLGAKDGFSEMAALDKDGDNKVTAAELEAGNVKVIKTHEDGTQEIVNASEVLKNQTDSIDLSSYQSENKDIGSGNKLLGTFDVNINGQELDGYQTLDTQNWLDANYEFTDEVAGLGRFAQDITTPQEVYKPERSVDDMNAQLDELDAKLDTVYTTMGFTRTEVKQFVEQTVDGSEKKAKKVENFFAEQTKAAEVQEAKKAEAEKEELEAELEEEKDEE